MNTFHRLTATAAIISLLSAMPLEAVDAKGNVATQKVEMDKYTKIASQWQEKIALMFPKVKDYHKVNLQNYEWSDLITVTLSKNGPGTPSLSIEINKETNQLYRFRLMEPAGVDREGDYRYKTSAGDKKAITDEQAKEKATTLLQSLYGAKAKNYQIISIWREPDRDAPGKTLPPIVNVKSPIEGNGKMATYASITFADDGGIGAYRIETKPTTFDKWYGTDLNTREMQDDILSQPAQVTYDKVIATLSHFEKFPLKNVTYEYHNQTFNVTLKHAQDQGWGSLNVATIAIKKNGQLKLLNYPTLSDKIPARDIAKQKATQFLQSFYKEKAQAYKIQEIMDWTYSGKNYDNQKGSMIQFSLPDKQDAIQIGVNGNGDIFTIYVNDGTK